MKSEEINDRLTVLERQNRMLRRFLMGAACLASVGLVGMYFSGQRAWGAASQPAVAAKSMSATSFDVVDDSGKVIATLGKMPDGTVGLAILGANGKQSVLLGTNGGKGMLALTSPDQTKGLVAVCGPEANAGPKLSLIDSKTSCAAEIGADEQRPGVLVKGSGRIMMLGITPQTDQAPSSALFSTMMQVNNKLVGTTVIGVNGETASVSLCDPRGVQRVFIGSNKGNQGSRIVLSNENGETTWAATPK